MKKIVTASDSSSCYNGIFIHGEHVFSRRSGQLWRAEETFKDLPDRILSKRLSERTLLLAVWEKHPVSGLMVAANSVARDIGLNNISEELLFAGDSVIVTIYDPPSRSYWLGYGGNKYRLKWRRSSETELNITMAFT
jgi:hypothetical protein